MQEPARVHAAPRAELSLVHRLHPLRRLRGERAVGQHGGSVRASELRRLIVFVVGTTLWQARPEVAEPPIARVRALLGAEFLETVRDVLVRRRVRAQSREVWAILCAGDACLVQFPLRWAGVLARHTSVSMVEDNKAELSTRVKGCDS